MKAVKSLNSKIEIKGSQVVIGETEDGLKLVDGVLSLDRQYGGKELSKTSKRPTSRIVYSEKLLERKLVAFMKTIGGEARKQHGGQITGLSDRALYAPPGMCWFAEIKTTGKPLKPKQEVEKQKVERMGFRCFVIDDNSSLVAAQNQMRQDVDLQKAKNKLKTP